jgi:hypothetical protein
MLPEGAVPQQFAIYEVYCRLDFECQSHDESA